MGTCPRFFRRREGRARFVPNAKGHKGVTWRQNPLNRYMRNSRILHHRDVLRPPCHNISRVIITISTQLCPFAYSLLGTGRLPCCLGLNAYSLMDMFQLYSVDS
jgi:hypothetical protein